MNLKAEASLNTKKKLKSAFVELYKEKGFSDITVNSVAKKAGCNRCTFYNHYDTLNDILLEIEDEIINDIKTTPIEIGLAAASSPDLIFSQFVEKIDQYGDYVYCLLGKNGDPAFRQKLLDETKSSVHNIVGCVSEEKTEYIQCFMMSSLFSLLEHWYETGKKYPTEQLLVITQQLILNGVSGVISKEITTEKDPANN